MFTHADPDLQSEFDCLKVYPHHYISKTVDQTAVKETMDKNQTAENTTKAGEDDDDDDRLFTNYEIAAIVMGILCFLALSWFLLFFVAFGEHSRDNEIQHLKHKPDFKHDLPDYYDTEFHISQNSSYENMNVKYNLVYDDHETRMAAYNNDELFWEATKTKEEPFVEKCLFYQGKE